jgi:putative hydrolase of the HAD superfamily
MGDVRAVLFDFGGVLSESPFDAFARFEAERGLPEGFLRTLHATNPDGNAWARLERSEIDLAEFRRLYEAEALEAGHAVDGGEVLPLLAGDLRPAMVEAVRRCAERLKTALLTNNVVEPMAGLDGTFRSVLPLFDVVIESSRVGVRKPDPRFYEMACEALGVGPHEAVFLDDLGVNLKPARAMGMATIKVDDPDRALDELEAVVGFPLR